MSEERKKRGWQTWVTVAVVLVLVPVALDGLVWTGISSRFGFIPGDYARTILYGLLILWVIRRSRR